MASTTKGKSGATLSTCSLVMGWREYGGRGLWERWREAMLLSSQWVREKRWGFGGHGLISSSPDQWPFYSNSKGDVGDNPSPGLQRARFPRVPMCCLMTG